MAKSLLDLFSRTSQKSISASQLMPIEGFSKLNPEQQTQYLVELSAGSLTSKDLSQDLLVPVFTIYSNLDTLTTVGKKLIDMAGPGTRYCAEAISEFTATLTGYDKSIQNSILSSFSQKITGPIDSLVANIGKAAVEGNKLLYGCAVMSGTHQILEGMAAFRKSVDSVVSPGLSDKIVAAGINSVVGFVALQAPVLGASMKLAGIPTKIVNFLKVENLQKNADLIKDKMDEIRQDKVLKEQLNQGQAIADKQAMSANQIKKDNHLPIKKSSTVVAEQAKDTQSFAERYPKAVIDGVNKLASGRDNSKQSNKEPINKGDSGRGM